MKDTLIVLCCPTLNRLFTQRAVGSLKETDLTRAELIVIDNNHDGGFYYPSVLSGMLKLAVDSGKNLILVEDDTEINDYNWIDRLYEVSERLKADIVGCVHTYEDGAVNHEGVYIDDDLTMWLRADVMTGREDVIDGAIYVPALYGAVMLIKNPSLYHIDTNYKKYHHDVDICLQAWRDGSRVACILDLKIIHHLRYYDLRNPSFIDIYNSDTLYFAKKWVSYAPELLEIPQLRRYKKGHSSDAAWPGFFNRAMKLRAFNKGLAVEMFNRVVAECYNERFVAEAYYQLFLIEGGMEHLKNCLIYNPCHGPAKRSLEDLSAKKSSFISQCRHPIICRQCHLLTQ
ncbi:MAG: hypothetical protein HQL06_06985 [Nitrospirae bacterium]|nr:hypothetical protein [Nitrospirota bacterium]